MADVIYKIMLIKTNKYSFIKSGVLTLQIKGGMKVHLSKGLGKYQWALQCNILPANALCR